MVSTNSSKLNTPKSVYTKKRCPVIFLIDVSGSMLGNKNDSSPPIDRLNKALDTCIRKLRNDNETNDIAEVCIISFSQKISIVRDFTLCEDIETPILTASGTTPKFFEVIEEGINQLQSYLDRIEKEGSYKLCQPMIMFMTDGQPTLADGKNITDMEVLNNSCDEIRNKLQSVKTKNLSKLKPQLHAFSVGQASDNSNYILKRLAGEHNSYFLEGYNFDNLFDWISKSIEMASQGREVPNYN
ncbi:vWA domain-containing protein [Chamaesiphon minutus]|uniref:VWFA domain-containing protein n=1 Tax=Chamaesiphon minutus (strain ATCC 27169 / PCC 6605) TaxID=1173020 RepID=K9URE8_CHAP6|nr:VWA domain-containing protein [Chamaesiphon minutus]AFY97248.1 uncharacterized protein Cha6605_6433 [Chamaesiphon minutus PCC 6605]